MLLMSIAYAGDAAAQQPSAIAQFVPLIIILGIMYFFLFRPNQKKFKAHQALIASLKKGDVVTTTGGIIGKITKVNDEKGIVSLEISPGVEVKINRTTVTELLTGDIAKEVTPSTVAAEKKAPKKKSAKK